MVLQVGDKLLNGKYTIECELGQGRFAITYLASMADGERRVVKVLNPQVLAELETQDLSEKIRLEDQFWSEAVSLALCNGLPHIVQMDMPFRENGVAYLPMEYMDGKSLADRGQRILKEDIALKFIRQIGESLAEIHLKKLIHCDIRPANIFLRSRDDVQEAVLADFGLALTFDVQVAPTRERELVDGFSAPELYTGGQIGAYTDVYSLAATLYELLTGVTPIGIKEKLMNQELDSPQEKNPLISDHTNDVILRGLEINPKKRPDSVVEWLKKLPIVDPKALIEQQPEPKSKKNWQTVWMAAAAIAGILAVVVAFFVGMPAWLTWIEQHSPPTPKPSTIPSNKVDVKDP
jgi:eukaryotic-like serine/threonine-protein kinase